MAGFIVVSGKFEHDGERNYKYISGEHSTLDAAIADWKKSAGYAFNEIEYNAPDGKTYVLDISER